MGNIIVIAILLIIAFFAVKSTRKHFKGEGGCCGGGGDCEDDRPKHKKLEGEKIAEKVIRIEGMHCDHCKNAVEREINQIDGAAAKVNLRKNIAVVSMDREIADEELEAAVERAGFRVAK